MTCSPDPYFEYYSSLQNQANMLSDTLRTSGYRSVDRRSEVSLSFWVARELITPCWLTIRNAILGNAVKGFQGQAGTSLTFRRRIRRVEKMYRGEKGKGGW